MYKTAKITLTKDNSQVDISILKHMCYHAARLYNCGLYNVRQHFFNTNKYLSYNSNYHLSKSNEHFQILLSDASQHILRLVDRDMLSFFKLLTLKKSGKYSENIRLPHYKKQNDLMICPIQGRSCRIQKDGKVAIGLTKEFRDLYNISERRFLLTIPKNIRHIEQFQEMRVIPQFNGKQFTIEFIYKDTKQPKQASGNGFMSIDLGVTNLATCTVFSNDNAHQFIIDGRWIKNVNYYYNKQTSKLKSEYSKHKSIDSGMTNRMMRLINGRNNRINDYFNKTCKYIVETCLNMGVSTLVIGYNKGQKQDINIGKVNNQNMVCIPHHKFRQKLMMLCEIHGVSYISQEESYTSKASSIDCDDIPIYTEGEKTNYVFSGTRTHRGLYTSCEGLVLNADINGSINILRKYFKERNWNWIYQDQVRAFVNMPCQRVNPLTQAPSFMGV